MYENSAWRSVKSEVPPGDKEEEVDLLDLNSPNAIVYESFAASPSLISPMVSPLQPLRTPPQLQHIDGGDDNDRGDDPLLLHEVSLYEDNRNQYGEDSGRQSIIMPRQLSDADYDPPVPLEPPPPVPTCGFTIEDEEKEE